MRGKVERWGKAERWICAGRRAKRWVKRQTARLRRRRERKGYEPKRLRDLTRGWVA